MSLSVIIPTWNEGSSIASTLRRLREHGPHEIIVADGGSTDATCRLAGAADRIVHSPRGRAIQMNHGADHASGKCLLFLHADCTLDPGALVEAEHILERRHVLAGCFRLTVQAKGTLYRLIDACATTRVRCTGFIYGDQGLFLRRDTFHDLGGFPPLRLMEDVFFSRMLKQRGRIVVASRRIHVSPRRWQRTGLVRQTLRNWMLTALAASGVHPDRLAPSYPAVR